MRAGFIEKPEVAYFIDNAEEPQIGNTTDVKIKVIAAGICGSEINAYHGKHPLRVPPVVSGHEFAGIVTEVGSDVAFYKPGDRVTAEPQYGCGHCVLCRDGVYHICEDKMILGARDWSGSFGEFVVMPEKCLLPLGREVSFEEGALIEPMAVGMHAIRQNNVCAGQKILIIGAGTIGLGLLLSTQLYNPSCIILADVVDFNLEIAGAMGCQYTVNTAREDLKTYVDYVTDGNGVDITFLAFGNAAVLETAARCTRGGGRISEIAMIPNGTGAPFRLLNRKELSIIGSNMYTYEDFQCVLDAMSKKLLPLKGMITHTFNIEKFQEAIEMADKHTEPCIKVMLTF